EEAEITRILHQLQKMIRHSSPQSQEYGTCQDSGELVRGIAHRYRRRSTGRSCTARGWSKLVGRGAPASRSRITEADGRGMYQACVPQPGLRLRRQRFWHGLRPRFEKSCLKPFNAPFRRWMRCEHPAASVLVPQMDLTAAVA